MRERASTVRNTDSELEASVHVHQPAPGRSPGCPPWSLLVGAFSPSTLCSLLLLLLRSPDLGPCLILVQNTNHVGQIHAFVNQHLLITK